MYGYKHYFFTLKISREELLDIYKGMYYNVRIHTEGGLVVELDVRHLKKFTTENGIRGRFRLTTSSSDKFIALEKLT